jgi:hypothetical protein
MPCSRNQSGAAVTLLHDEATYLQNHIAGPRLGAFWGAFPGAISGAAAGPKRCVSWSIWGAERGGGVNPYNPMACSPPKARLTHVEIFLFCPSSISARVQLSPV